MTSLEALSDIAVKSLLYEVAASPKPGLVDGINSGAHKDMDIFTFIDSSHALRPYFEDAVHIGARYTKGDLKGLFALIRARGIKAEAEMSAATGGVNTHKGAVFSMGLIVTAAGYLHANGKRPNRENLSEICVQMTDGLLERDFRGISEENATTNGERLYARYGIEGIRGESVKGYPIITERALPVLEHCLEWGYSFNDSSVQTLLHIMVLLEDTNILGRHNMETLDYVKKEAERALELGGILSEQGMAYIRKMDEDFIRRNISPGGAADMLALTQAIYYFESLEIG